MTETDIPTAERLVQMARLMRKAQRRFYQSRHPAELQEAKRLEIEFDRALARHEDGKLQRRLF